MNKIKYTTILIFQILLFVESFSQAQNNRFIIAWYDHSGTTAAIENMTQHYKDM